MTTDTKSELAAILTGAAIFPLDDRAFLRITGSDATRWLNGMVTNSIQALAPGEGNYNFLLNAQGRIQGDCTIYREPGDEPTFLLETAKSQIDAIRQHLDKFIIMDDVELTIGMKIEMNRVEKSPSGLAMTGTLAPDLLLKTIEPSYPLVEPFQFDLPAPGTMKRGTLEGNEVVVLAPPQASIPTYEVWCYSTRQIKELYRVWEFFKADPTSPEAQEAYRILSGTPRFGIDIRDKDLPQETNQTHALHFSKGCYLGQEIVERIRSRGQVHRTFSGFRLTALPATLPVPLTSDGKPAGELTSAAVVPLPEGDAILALGYVRREALDRNQPLDYEGGSATPTALPFLMTTS